MIVYRRVRFLAIEGSRLIANASHIAPSMDAHDAIFGATNVRTEK